MSVLQALPVAAPGACIGRSSRAGPLQLPSLRAARPAQQQHRPRRAAHRVAAMGGGSGSDDLLVSPAICPVPKDQQPIHELESLQEMAMFSWATVPGTDFAKKLAWSFGSFFLTLGLPISLFTFNFEKEPAQCLVSASIGSMFIVTILVWRLYLGWQHVGDRLLSATVEYEETGWYDGQVWVKTPEVIMRDRLQCNYTVKPALARLKQTLVGLGGALAASVVLLACLPPPQVNSAPASYASVSSQVAARAASNIDEAAARYEAWGAEEEGDDGDDGGSSSGFDVRAHLLAPGQAVVQYNQQ